MTFKKILIKEKEKKPDEVLLVREGLFLKAYEGSAWALAKKSGFKPTKRFVKIVGQEVVSVGFPATSLGIVRFLSERMKIASKLKAVFVVRNSSERMYACLDIAG